MEAITILVVGILNIGCFFCGAKVGNAVSKGRDVETPTVNPMKLYQAHREQKEADEEKNRLNIILRNIERYDGTGVGQEDVPR